MEFPRVVTFHTFLSFGIQELYLQDPQIAAEYTRDFMPNAEEDPPFPSQYSSNDSPGLMSSQLHDTPTAPRMNPGIRLLEWHFL